MAPGVVLDDEPVVGVPSAMLVDPGVEVVLPVFGVIVKVIPVATLNPCASI